MKRPARATNGTQAASPSGGGLGEHRVLGFGEVQGHGQWKIDVKPKGYVNTGQFRIGLFPSRLLSFFIENLKRRDMERTPLDLLLLFLFSFLHHPFIEYNPRLCLPLPLALQGTEGFMELPEPEGSQ